MNSLICSKVVCSIAQMTFMKIPVLELSNRCRCGKLRITTLLTYILILIAQYGPLAIVFHRGFPTLRLEKRLGRLG